MTLSITSDTVAHYLALAIAGESRKATRLALDLLDAGVPFTAISDDLLAVVQQEVGERWHRGEWSYAQEHLVTGTAQATLEALADAVMEVEQHGLAVVACAEGEWHSLAAQMFSESLRATGQGVIFLGASTSPAELVAVANHRRLDAVAISCTLAINVKGTARLVDAAHRRGLPVIAGGHALTAAIATRLGADAWADEVVDAAHILRGWRDRPPEVAADPVWLDERALHLDAHALELGERAAETLGAHCPDLDSYDNRQRSRTREMLGNLVANLAAARLVEEPAVFHGYLAWLAPHLVATAVPASALPAGLAALVPFLRDIDAEAARFVASCIGSVRDGASATA